jgi:hypothetical protein
MEYVPPVSRFLACGAASKLLACRGSTALYITPSGLGVLIRELETNSDSAYLIARHAMSALRVPAANCLEWSRRVLRSSMRRIPRSGSRRLKLAFPYPSLRHHWSRLTYCRPDGHSSWLRLPGFLF